MNRTLRASSMLVVLLGLATFPCTAQNSFAGSDAVTKVHETVSKVNQSVARALSNVDFGVTYTFKVAKIAEQPGPYFTISGGSIDAVYDLNSELKRLRLTKLNHFGHVGLALDASMESSSSISPGIGLTQFSLVAGPRYTMPQLKLHGHKVTVYGETLVGFVHAYNSLFPTGTSISSSASSFAIQAGSGVNLPINKMFGVRILEADYILTKFSNSSANYQGDVRLSTGITFHY